MSATNWHAFILGWGQTPFEPLTLGACKDDSLGNLVDQFHAEQSRGISLREIHPRGNREAMAALSRKPDDLVQAGLRHRGQARMNVVQGLLIINPVGMNTALPRLLTVDSDRERSAILIQRAGAH